MAKVEIQRADETCISDIFELERVCFASPWPPEVLYEDICISKHHYYVIKENEKIIGYAGMWLILDEAHITANKNTSPNDPKSPFVTSGVRLGTPAATSRGLNTEDMEQVAEAISIVIKEGEAGIGKAQAIIKTLTDKYPLV